MKAPLTAYRAWVSLLLLYVLYLSSAFWIERRMMWTAWRRENTAEMQAILQAWQASHQRPTIPERSKWTRPRWGR